MNISMCFDYCYIDFYLLIVVEKTRILSNKNYILSNFFIENFHKLYYYNYIYN